MTERYSIHRNLLMVKHMNKIRSMDMHRNIKEGRSTPKFWKRTFKKMIKGTTFKRASIKKLSAIYLRIDLCRPICELYKRKCSMNLDEQYKRRL